MARSRNIKPSFFTNDVLAECSTLARLLFIGLWTLADREGRLEDRPKKIKAEVLPYDDCDAEKLLTELSHNRFIVRYERAGTKYIQVLNFAKHQNPHQKEGASTIPAPDLHQTSNNLGDDEPGLNLIPDSPILIPDSLTPDECREAVEVYNGFAEKLGLTKVQKLTTSRKTQLRARLRENGGLEGWYEVCRKIEGSKFCQGANDKGWKADFDFLVKDTNFVKIMEGKYDARAKSDRHNAMLEGFGKAIAIDS